MQIEEAIKEIEYAKSFGTSGVVPRWEAIETVLNELEKKDKIIDLIVNTIVADKKILALVCKHIINKTDEECEKQNSLCDDCIKEYFYKKVSENNDN